jgi:hypothetical protein
MAETMKAPEQPKAGTRAGVPTDDPNTLNIKFQEEAKAKATPPGTVVELIKALEKSGTGRDKLNAALVAVEEWHLKYKSLPTTEEFYEYVRGDANKVPPQPALLPPGTLAKVKYLIDTGDPLPPGGVDQGALDFASRLAALNESHPVDFHSALPAPGAPDRPPGAPAAASVPKEQGGTEGQFIQDRSRAAQGLTESVPSTQSGPRIEKVAKEIKGEKP